MADLLPSIPDTSAPEQTEPRVVGLSDDDADDVLGALSSTTARELFAAVNEDPAHPSALADRIDTTLQNCQYHLGKLEDAGLVEVVDTAYSAKGREMDVYAPADQPLVVFAGDERDRSLLSRALGRLLGGLGVVSAASVIAQGIFSRREAAGAGAVEVEPESVTQGDGGASAADGDDTPVAGGGDGQGDGGDGGADGGGHADDGAVEDEYVEETGGGETGGEEADVATDADGGADADAGTDLRDAGEADPVVETVSPVADQFDWVGDLLAATGLEPGIAVFVLGALGVTLGVGLWYRRVAVERRP